MKNVPVVIRKRDSPQAIVVSRVQARPIQIERPRYVPRFCLGRQVFPVIGKTAGSWWDSSGMDYRDIVAFRAWDFVRGEDRRLDDPSPYRTDASVRCAAPPPRKRGINEKNEEIHRARISTASAPPRRDPRFMPDPAAPADSHRTNEAINSRLLRAVSSPTTKTLPGRER